MARPGMASVAIFNFLGLWNQFLLPVALNTNRDNYVLSQGMAAFASRCPRGRASSGFVVRRTGGDRYSHAVIAHLPSALRCRVVLGVVAALLAGSGVLGAAAVGTSVIEDGVTDGKYT
ncbi:hypothetical protein [Mumia sp. zg.B53]|uniref:hypothetical protein n=1 Tax=Mumia sp. zg.B53 TaxID=2855449 RepID=UPI0027E25100|nr:hypothetical protein [Mumia sp. zg.B53]